jgi:hypothetical protein
VTVRLLSVKLDVLRPECPEAGGPSRAAITLENWGGSVRGITKMQTGAAEGYWFDPRFHYAQSVGKTQKRIDWDPSRIARPPTAPAQGVLAAAQIRNERDVVFTAWEQLALTE